MSDRILAAVMPAPERPIEIREYARPDLPTGAALLGRRDPKSAALTSTSGTVYCRACPIRSFPDTSRPVFSTRCVARSVVSMARGFAEGDRVVFFDVHRTCGRCRPLRRPSHADAMHRAARLRHHRPGR